MFRASRRYLRLASRRAGWRRVPAGLEILEPRQLLATQPYVVSVTADSLAAGTLRSAILAANADTDPGPFDVVFDIPASTAPELNVPVTGFDPVTQTWQITLNSPLPTITHPISIDGFSQALDDVPYRYSDEVVSTVQSLTMIGTPTGGTFTLTTAAPLPVATTSPISYTATPQQVQSALAAIVGNENVSVASPTAGTLSITFQGVYAGESIPTLVADSSALTGGTDPYAFIGTSTIGSLLDPSEITSVPNSTNAIDGDNAQVRVILDGSQTGGATGLVLNTSQSTIRGLAIEGFGIGISIPSPTDAGDLIQGNFIGPYLAYPVDQGTGDPLPSPSTVILAGAGNSEEGILLDSANATVGGFNPDENNVISGNGAQGVLMMPGSSGNQILGNQIGVIGPSTNGLYFQIANGGDGVSIESSGTASDPSGIVYSSSNVVGGAVAGSGNVISFNGGYGVHLTGVGATRNLVEANFIGVAPGGGYVYGTGNPGNTDDGVRLDDAPDNQIGGPAASDGNVISSNQGAGVYVTGADAAGNSIANNIIGLVSSGTAVLGNDAAGVADYSPGTLIGPGNVISDNLTGVLISGASATGVIVRDNLIGTDSSGSGDLGNVEDGVQIVDASGNTIEGDNLGVQVISGNLVGVEIDGATANVIQGNLIGTDKSGTADRGNSNQGILIEGAQRNTIGGTTAAARNVISANQWGIQIDGSTATLNLIEGNDVGTDITGKAPLGNEINGIILSTDASNNTIGGAGGGQGNLIAYNVEAGVLVQSGTGDSILSNSIFSNGQQGIALVSGNDLQSAPALTGTSGGGTGTNVVGSLTSVANTSFLIQFFSSLVPDPSGVGQGQTFLGETVVTTTAAGTAPIDFNVASGLAIGTWMTVTATNESTGDSSGFSNAVAAAPVSISFASAAPSVQSTGGTATIEVDRSGNVAVSVSINFATSNGSAVAGQDYTAVSGVLTFAPDQTDAFFSIPTLPDPTSPTTFSTVNLTLSQPAGGATLGSIALATLTILNNTAGNPLTFVVTNTGDSGPGTLRAAITAANQDSSTDVDNIVFEIPASTAGNQNIPVAGFDPINQVWTISLESSLPAITHPVTIDGFTEANTAVGYRYPDQVTSAVQDIIISGNPTGGSFTLSTLAPLPVGTTPPISYAATPEQIEQALVTILGTESAGTDNVSVTESTPGTFAVTFQGDFADEAIPTLIAADDFTGGSGPSIAIQTVTVGGLPITTPSLITSVPNSTTAINGNNAQVRVILDGSQTGGSTGLVLDTSQSIIRGLAIEGFGTGISIPNPTNVGDLIQGNSIGEYLVYPVDPLAGTPLPSPNTVELAGLGNTQEGIMLGSANATVGGDEAQDANVIGGNGAQGVLIIPGASGNQVLGNQIGIIGPSANGLYFLAGNGSDGVTIESSGTASDPSGIVFSSSNVIGGAASGSGNIISANHGFGVHLIGVGATRNLVEANYIGAAPGGGYVFGTGQPGNAEDGVHIDDAPDNQVGGLAAADGNAISSNKGAGVYVTGANATGNTVENNIIGLTADGGAALGNDGAGVADYSPGTLIGPGNVISDNQTGVLISGSSATGVIVRDNLIGTDSTGTADLGNAQDGIQIVDASGNTIEGDNLGVQVISGNLAGIEIDGKSTQNLIEGNLIGTNKSGTADLGNSNQGVLIEGAYGNTIGGTTAAARNVISANQWGIQIDGSTATLNLIEGNNVGTDITGTAPLGNEINGIILSNDASDNSIGGTGGGQGNIIAFNVEAGVLAQSGTGDSILSNSIFSNGQQGIALVNGNDLQSAPALTGTSGGGTGSNVEGSLTSVPNTSFLIQFFSSLVPDPSGVGQGQTFLGGTIVTTGPGGTAAIDFNVATGLAIGTWMTVTATNESTGDSSGFSNAVSAQPVSISFATAASTVASTAGAATIDVQRSGNLAVAVSINFATSNGSAVAGQNYTAVSGIFTFAPNQTNKFISIPILADLTSTTTSSTVNLTLSQPAGGATLGAIAFAMLTITNNATGNPLTFVVTNTGDSGPGSLRDAILAANQDPNPDVDNIVFDIPASTAGNQNVPVAGFDPITQTWTITLESALPVITHPVTIDGFTEANTAVPFRYPDQITSAVQDLSIGGNPTGGSFTLSTLAPLPVGTTAPIPFSATPEDIEQALVTILGTDRSGIDNVSVTESTPGILAIAFQGDDADEAIPNLVVTNGLTGGLDPSVLIQTVTVGGVPIGNPTLITSVPNSTAAIDGNNAQIRVILNGNQTGGSTGLVLATSQSVIRGLAVEGFGVGISVPNPTDVGDLIQGNSIGEYLVYPVDSLTGVALPSPNTVELAGLGNTEEGILLGSANATVGGIEAQDANVIGGNGAQGVLIIPGASGNQVLGNQIGVIGPSTGGLYFPAGNGSDGVAIESSGTAGNPSSIVYSSSNVIGGAAAGSGNIISANHGYGVYISGVGATSNLVEANYIGAAPGGGYAFGNGQPGNSADGVHIDDAPENQVGGPAAADGNVISSNKGAGVYVTGADAIGNSIENNIIGLTAAGTGVLGNDGAGVADYSPGTLIGPGNVISDNLVGVLISGASATGVIVRNNLIGTDSTGTVDLGNAEDGVQIDNASDNTIEGTGQAAQVISGNLVGIEIDGTTSTQNLIEGNLIGTDKSGAADLGNSNEGILIEGAFGNTVGGTTSAARNVISANQWGVRLDGSTATLNLIEGNYVGTDITGTLALGNEINGIIVSNSASNNTIGGTGTGQGNTIAYNVAAGVSVQSGTGDSILSNSIFSNGHLGIDLVAPGDPPDGVTPNAPGVRVGPNDLQNYPVMTAVVAGTKGAAQASLNGLPNTPFLIQFFSNTTPDPTGYGQGQTLLGSQAITTSASGAAVVSLTPQNGVPADTWVSATATDLLSGDTSEFARDLTAQPVSVQFETMQYAVNSSAGVATIEVERTGNVSALVTVQYSTSNGTALAGKQYEPASGTLTFLAGQSYSEQTFPITILPSTSQSAFTTTVNLTLSQPTGGATLGAFDTATLSISELPVPPPPPPPPPPPISLVAPRLTSEQLVTNGQSITSIVLGFSKPLVPVRAQNLASFGYFVYAAGANGVFGSNDGNYVGLSSAVYTGALQSVTLTPSVPLSLNTFWRVTVDGQTSTLLNNGLTDSSNNLLIGSDGAVGTPLFVTFAAGKRLAYTDSARNVVSLQLTKGGLMELFQASTGAVQQLDLAGTIARKTTLSGSVRRGRGGTGRSILPPISGTAGVRMKLKSPPFIFRSTSLIADAEVSESSSGAAIRTGSMAGRALARLSRLHY
jgi:hypothetical protein